MLLFTEILYTPMLYLCKGLTCFLSFRKIRDESQKFEYVII